MALSEHRTIIQTGVSDMKRTTSPDGDTSLSSPRPGDGQRICIDALCRSPLSPRGQLCIARPKEPSASQGMHTETMCENGANPQSLTFLEEVDTKSSSLRYFSVHLVVAAVAEGDILSDNGTRKTKCVLDQLTRNVSKEQNQVVVLPVENSCIPLKLRVFVKASLEAKALNDYFSRNHDQMPAPFIMLSQGLHMVVAYDKDLLDPSEAGVADRFRKQAKTRAVKLIKEALECPSLGISSALLRGHMGAWSPAQLIDPFLLSKCTNLPYDPEHPSNKDSEGCRCFIFEAKHKKNCTSSPQISAQPHIESSCTAQERAASPLSLAHDTHTEVPTSATRNKRSLDDTAPSQQASSYFPVTLYITAVGDGTLARNVGDKARERLESILTKIPKEQQTSIECAGALVPLKLRVFVANSEDAKAVGDYIRDHASQCPAPVVLLCREVFISLRCEGGLDMKDSAVADRLRKQAKTRAVKLVRDLMMQAKHMTLPILRGQDGPLAPAAILEPLLSNYLAGKGEGFWTDGNGKKFALFSAKSKFNASPAIMPESPRASSPCIPDTFSLEPAAVSLSDPKPRVTIDVSRERMCLELHEGAQQYTPSSLEGALLLDSCRILAHKEDKGVVWAPSRSQGLNKVERGTGSKAQSKGMTCLVDGCWQGLDEGGEAAGSPLQRSKRVRLNPV